MGTSIVSPATAKLIIDGQVVSLVASPKVLDATDFTYTKATPFVAGNHTYAIEVKDTLNQVVADSGTFISVNTPSLGAAQKATSVDTSKSGFVWRVFQNESAHLTAGLTIPEYLAECEAALTGKLSDGAGGFLPNLANPDSQGPALATGVLDGTLHKYEIPTVIYLHKAADGTRSNPNPPILDPIVIADQMPGIPGLSGLDDGIDAEIRTFVELPAGVTRFGIGCNNYFRIQGGLINNPTNGATLIGEGVGSNGQLTPTLLNVFAETAGVYPFRIIYQHVSEPPNGNAWITLYTIKANGDSVLLGDVANGGLKAYRSGVVPTPSTSYSLTATHPGGQIQLNWTEPGVVLQESTSVSSGWTSLPAATSGYKVPTGPRANVFYRLKK